MSHGRCSFVYPLPPGRRRNSALAMALIVVL